MRFDICDLTNYQHPPCMFTLWYVFLLLGFLAPYVEDAVNYVAEATKPSDKPAPPPKAEEEPPPPPPAEEEAPPEAAPEEAAEPEAPAEGEETA